MLTVPNNLKAIIVGGGIGGLTAGIALRQAGIQAVVYERASDLKEIGAGIALASCVSGRVRLSSVSTTPKRTVLEIFQQIQFAGL